MDNKAFNSTTDNRNSSSRSKRRATVVRALHSSFVIHVHLPAYSLLLSQHAFQRSLLTSIARPAAQETACDREN